MLLYFLALMQNLKKVISLHEASRISGYNQDYLSSLIRKNEIKGEKLGGNWFTTREEIKNYVFKQKIKNKTWVTRQLLFFARANRALIYAVIVLAVFSAGIYSFNKKYEETHAEIKNVDTQLSGLNKSETKEVAKELKF